MIFFCGLKWKIIILVSVVLFLLMFCVLMIVLLFLVICFSYGMFVDCDEDDMFVCVFMFDVVSMLKVVSGFSIVVIRSFVIIVLKIKGVMNCYIEIFVVWVIMSLYFLFSVISVIMDENSMIKGVVCCRSSGRCRSVI